MKDIQTSLICSHCLKEAPVKITYLGNSMVKVTCKSCGYTIKISPTPSSCISSVKWEHRLLTKPIRLALEMKTDSLHFISTFPLRVITKPLRIVRELEKALLKVG
ncbi:hypothetical protein IBX65_04685 [Candidatus Aerophobetes bacterium]|nr:hypothetical protein [Candidatus Aerophobetes bacterium]